MQVSAALPKLQVLDDTNLERPLSPAWRLPHPHKRTHPTHAPLLAASHCPSALAIATDTALQGAGPGPCTARVSEPPQHASSNMALTRADMSWSRGQRPASASRLQQRLPPVALGHNQPGSYLLYSLTHQPPDAPHYTAPAEIMAGARRLGAVAGTAQCLGGQSLCTEAHAVPDISGGSVSAGESRQRRPVSAGIRRAESRLQSPDLSESSSRCSAALALLARLLTVCHTSFTQPVHTMLHRPLVPGNIV